MMFNAHVTEIRYYRAN